MIEPVKQATANPRFFFQANDYRKESGGAFWTTVDHSDMRGLDTA
jgi:hypothetical protein